tara:strand:+ start:992 stop:1867 length:876 start_codon:yes stop_codon:yes gene_type:complete
MSLNDIYRIRDQLNKNTIEQQTIPAKETEFIPYSSIKHILDSFPLVSKINTSKLEIHKCLTYMLHKKKILVQKEENCDKSDIKQSESDDKKNTRKECLHCKSSKLLLSVSFGDIVCQDCGVVQRGVVFGESIHIPISEDELRQLEKGSDHNNCISDWVMAQNSYGNVWHELQLSKEIDHWNYYVNATLDELTEIKKVSSWMERRSSDESRIVAAFIFVLIINPQIVYEELDGNNFPEIHYNSTSTNYSCSKCNEIFNEIYIMRKHKCYNNKDKKRKQISCVKNKTTKIKFC